MTRDSSATRHDHNMNICEWSSLTLLAAVFQW